MVPTECHVPSRGREVGQKARVRLFPRFSTTILDQRCPETAPGQKLPASHDPILCHEASVKGEGD